MALVVEDSGRPLEAVFEALRHRVEAYARRIAGPDLAEDVVQEVFLRLLAYKRNNLGEITFGFILTMTRNVARTMIHQRCRRTTVLHDATNGRGEATAPSAADTASAQSGWALARAIASRLQALPQRQLDAFVLTELRGLSEEQAGLALDMSRTAINARRRAAIDRLKADVEVVSGAPAGLRAGAGDVRCA